jgi:hypothetical protein
MKSLSLLMVACFVVLFSTVEQADAGSLLARISGTDANCSSLVAARTPVRSLASRLCDNRQARLASRASASCSSAAVASCSAATVASCSSGSALVVGSAPQPATAAPCDCGKCECVTCEPVGESQLQSVTPEMAPIMVSPEIDVRYTPAPKNSAAGYLSSKSSWQTVEHSQ